MGDIPPGLLRIEGRSSSLGFGRCALAVPIQELIATRGAMPNDLGEDGTGLFFEACQAQLTEDIVVILTEMAHWLRTEDNVTLRVEGHCSNEEDSGIALKRATAVKDELASLGVKAERMTAVNCSSRHPM